MELYCIKSHSRDVVVKGQIYQMISDKCPCKCPNVDVGVKGSNKASDFFGNISPICIGDPVTCRSCGVTKPYDGIWWIHKSLFANIDEISLEEVEEILNGELVEI